MKSLFLITIRFCFSASVLHSRKFARLSSMGRQSSFKFGILPDKSGLEQSPPHTIAVRTVLSLCMTWRTTSRSIMSSNGYTKLTGMHVKMWTSFWSETSPILPPSALSARNRVKNSQTVSVSNFWKHLPRHPPTWNKPFLPWQVKSKHGWRLSLPYRDLKSRASTFVAKQSTRNRAAAELGISLPTPLFWFFLLQRDVPFAGASCFILF